MSQEGNINEIDIEKESDVEKDDVNEENSDDKYSIFSQSSKEIENINFTFDIMESYSQFPQLRNGQLYLSKIQDAQLMKTKQNRGKGYTAGNSSITEVVIDKKPTKLLLDPGAFCSCVGKYFLNNCVPVTTTNNHPPNGCCGNSSLNQVYGQKGPRGSSSAPKPQVDPPDPVLAPKPNQLTNGQNTLGPKSGHNSAHGPWQPPEATSSAPSKDSPQVQGNIFPSSIHPTLKDPGVVHIWYNIPLCTIFAHKSNGDTLRTKLCDSISSPQSIANYKGGFFSYLVWQFPGSYQKTIQGPQPPGPAGVGLSILIRTILREILRDY
ncbi:hypothetical protein O181_048932 [Austropuccinia psidii MF-1]|uniref:Uncharacterized protein n=1 Tax=Austropuccinia psidii MF-1 TaxID=1389203 RepID=A0A9Q3HM44_9BASI|nr:hypothetical protein [Austropuccinia psidii MF-1]